MLDWARLLVLAVLAAPLSLMATDKPQEDWDSRAKAALPSWARPRLGEHGDKTEHERQRQHMLEIMTPLCIEISNESNLPHPRAQLENLFLYLFDPEIVGEPIHSDEQVLEGWRCLYMSLLEGHHFYELGQVDDGIVKQLRAIWMIVGIHKKSLQKNRQSSEYYAEVKRFRESVNQRF